MELQHVFVAMSGGVDSSVAAVLLQEQGYRISGIHLEMISNQLLSAGDQDGVEKNTRDAGKVAQKLGFPFYDYDYSKIFKDTVISYFVSEYQNGRTPNPCIFCNQRIKFGELLQQVRSMGADYLATGHYAQVARDESTGRWLLRRGTDRRKDQSYFLYRLNQDQLSHVLFPLGGMEKPEVRKIAVAHNLEIAQKKDSQDICFVPHGDYASVIEQYLGKPSPAGPFLSQDGKVLGQHKGLIRYTLGQHKGLGLSTEEPLYVLEKNVEHNAIRLGPESALWSRSLVADQMNWISIPELTEPIQVTVKTRYTQKEAKAVVEPLPDGRIRVLFDEPQRAITPGQAVVLYDGENVVGGGVITNEK